LDASIFFILGSPTQGEDLGTGSIDEVGVFDEALSESDIMFHMTNGVAAGSSGSTFPLTITPNGANYDFTWDSQDGKVYDLVSATDLSTPPAGWAVYMGNEDIVGSAPSQTLENVPGDGTERFFAVVEKDPRR